MKLYQGAGGYPNVVHTSNRWTSKLSACGLPLDDAAVVEVMSVPAGHKLCWRCRKSWPPYELEQIRFD